MLNVADSDISEDTSNAPQRVQWRVRVDGNVYGPYPRSRLLEFLEEGRIAGHTQLACGADEDFYRADEHPNLRWRFDGEPSHNAAEDDRAHPVCNYFISARILASTQDFEHVLNRAGQFSRAGANNWVLRSRTPLPQLRNQLSVALKKDEQFVIVNATKGRLAWFNLGAETDIAIRSVWNADLKDSAKDA